MPSSNERQRELRAGMRNVSTYLDKEKDAALLAFLDELSRDRCRREWCRAALIAAMGECEARGLKGSMAAAFMENWAGSGD